MYCTRNRLHVEGIGIPHNNASEISTTSGFGSFHRGAQGQHRNSNYHSNRPPRERELGKRSRVPLQKMLSLSSLQSFLTLQLLLELAPRHEVSRASTQRGLRNMYLAPQSTDVQSAIWSLSFLC